MAYVSQESSTQTSVRLYVGGLNTSSTYTNITITCNGITSGNLAKAGSGQSTSNSVTFGNLTCGRSYSASCSLRTSAGSTGSGSGTGTTQACPPPPPSQPSLSINSINGKTITVNVSHSSNTTSIDFDYYWIDGYPNATKSVSGTLSTHTFTVPAYSTSYGMDCLAKNASGGSPWSSSLNFTSGSAPAPPATPANFRVVSRTSTSMLLAWDSVSGTTYNVEAYLAGTTTNPVYQGYGIAGTSVSVTGLKDYTAYDFKLYAVNANGNSVPTWKYNEQTYDETPPTISITSSSGLGTMTVHFSGNDAGVGLRTPNRYAVHIGTQNGGAGTTVFKDYTDNTFYTFTTDADGIGFVNGSSYWVKVYAYDAVGNSAGTSVQITYTRTRPADWAWHTEKIAGNPFQLTATEWNSFCTKINQFRVYKGYSEYTFTSAVSGSPVTASIFNQAITAISAMNPTVALPSTKTAGTSKVLASDFNTLRNSLNSIT